MNAAVKRVLGCYEETEKSHIDFTSQHGLVASLFSGLEDTLTEVKKSALNKDLKNQSDQITKAQGILYGLSESLNFEKGGELALNLFNLYDYCIRQLTIFHTRDELDKLEEVINIIRGIKKSWSLIA